MSGKKRLSPAKRAEIEMLGVLASRSGKMAKAMTPEEVEIYDEGERANDHNKRVYRKQKGTLIGNPYVVGSPEWNLWKNGYAYQDMVNDG